MKRYFLSLFIALLSSAGAMAQIGEHRNDFALGLNAGFEMANVGFVPKVTQGMQNGISGGLTMRYTSEKYFKTIASIYAEFNYTQMGWNEDIIDLHSQPVVGANGAPEQYSRRLTYVQMPLLAHLAWGNERRGMQFYFQAGPQFGYFLGESTTTNFTLDDANFADRANKCSAQYSMDVENFFDYGIAVGLGVEYSHPSAGHFLLGARYYYGLGNLFGASKQDYFGKSNNGAIEIRLAYLVDLSRTRMLGKGRR